MIKKVITMRIFRRRSAITHFVNINYVHYNEIKSGIYFKIIIPVLRYYQLKRSTVCECGNTYIYIFLYLKKLQHYLEVIALFEDFSTKAGFSLV